MKKYNNDIYLMYEEECNKNILLNKQINQYKLENNNLQYELNYKIKSFDNKIDKAIKAATTPLIQELETAKIELEKAYKEIERLKYKLFSKLTKIIINY